MGNMGDDSTQMLLTFFGNDLHADFLPLFVWVLAHCGFETAEIESEYMWGLAHPSLFNGEGGYYLTTLTSAGTYTLPTVCP